LYLKEWLDFHLRIGIEYFYLYNNNSTDNFQDILRPYEIDNKATVICWPIHKGQTQLLAYNNCLAEFNRKNKWIAFIDCDEFLYCPNNGDLKILLQEFEPYGGLAVNWQVYGSNGHKTKTAGGVLERFTKRAETQTTFNSHIKSIVQPDKVIASVNPHYFKYKDSFGAVNEQGKPVTGPFSYPVSINRVRINHYLCKSEEEGKIRFERGRADEWPNRPWQEWIDTDNVSNTVDDTSALEIYRR
jgi:hypothetical protein